MSIEYLPNIKPGGKIDLPITPLRVEKYLPDLQKGLESMASQENNDLGFEFLEADGRIKLSGPDEKIDQEFVDERELEWSANQKKDRSRWLKDQEKNKANLAEMALILLLDKYFSQHFLVARASVYDDYKNGADTVLIDRHSGSLVCGFDEVLGNVGDDGGLKKEKKVRQTMLAGGSQIKYGATVDEDNNWQPATRNNVPTFYLSLSKSELEDLLPSLIDQADEKKEKEILGKLLDSLSEQLSTNSQLNLSQNLCNNLKNFQDSWELMNKTLKSNK